MPAIPVTHVMSGGLPFARPVTLPSTSAPRIFVVVDTEEEFDWGAPVERSSTSVSAMQSIDRAQAIFDRFGIKPTYVIDFPVVSQASGYEPLQRIWKDGRCQIGAHLHPWVNPPLAEDVNGPNSFTMNLPAPLQREKLEALTEAISARFERPRVFKAGRYGLGADTVALIDSLGYEVDTSVCPRMDFTPEQGPSFAGFNSDPFFLTDRLLEIPCTVDYVGWAGPFGRPVHALASHGVFRPFRAVGALARAGVVNQIMLSPEGNTYDEMCRLAQALVRRGCRALTLSFHSPSVEPGHTPYVRTNAELAEFLDRIERFCAFFMTELGGRPDTPLAFRDRVIASTGHHQ